MNLVRFNNRNKTIMPYFSDVFDSLFDNTLQKNYGITKTPQVNISESAEAYQIEMASPGLSKEDFKIELLKDQLKISVEKKAKSTEEQKDYSRKEFEYYTFERSFTLPDDVEPENIKAEYLNGILSISLAKKSAAEESKKEILVS